MSDILTPATLSRRRALAIVGAGFGGVVLAACKPSTEAPGPALSTVSSPTQTSIAAPKAGGRLRFAMATDLDQGVEAARLGNAYTPSVFMMFDTLTAYD